MTLITRKIRVLGFSFRLVLVSCEDPGHIPHATRDSNSEGRFETGANLMYTCEDGYIGGGTITCDENGYWSLLSSCIPSGKNSTFILNNMHVKRIFESHVQD